jgi:hypothetical protein
MNVGTPPWPNRPKSSAPIVCSTSSTFASPSSRTSAGTTRETRPGVLTVGGVPSPTVTVGAGARWAWASAAERRFRPSINWSRTSSRKARMVNCRWTSWG